MRIRLVSSSSGSRGGGEFYLHSLALGLRELGHNVETVMSLHTSMDDFADRFLADDLQVTRWDYLNTYRRPLRSVGAVFAKRDIQRITNDLTHSDCDVIHINQQCVEDGLDLLLAASKCHIPAVSTIHVIRSMSNLNAMGGVIRDVFARRTITRCGLDLIGTSAHLAKDLRSYLNLPSEDNRVHTVLNGVATPKISGKPTLREELGVSESDILLGCVARIEAQKNPFFVPQFLERLPDHVHFVWIGDGQLRPELEKLVQERKLTQRFHFDGWRSDAAMRMHELDVFALPSMYEGLPFALLEAMSLGIPCVISQVDGVADAIDSGTNGFLCEVNDVEAWTDVLTKLVKSADLREKISEQAMHTHRSRLSLHAMASHTIQVYENVISA